MTLPILGFKGRTHRLIASRYPTIGPFDEIADTAEDLRVAFILDNLTNDRLTLLRHRIDLLPDEEIVSGEGASIVMAAFLHTAEAGGRFNDGRLGAWYAAAAVETAIAETLFHHERRLKASEAGFPAGIEMRELICDIDLPLGDLAADPAARAAVLDPDPESYPAGQAFAAALRWPEEGQALRGLHYPSLRHKGGRNVCLFWPSDIPCPPLQGGHFRYAWDATGRSSIARLTAP